MALEPITRMEKILSGEKIDPVTRREYFVQEAVQNGGGGGGDDEGETYETVAEIEVGAMEHMTGMYYATTEVPFPAISDTETYYLNDSENPNSGFVYDDGEVDGILWNCEIVDEQPAPIDSSKPYVFIGSNHGVIGIGSDEDLANTTVRIIKEASAPSGGSDRLVVTLTKTGTGSEAVYTSTKSGVECVAAYNAGKEVVCRYNGNEYPMLGVDAQNVAQFSFVVVRSSNTGGLLATSRISCVVETNTWTETNDILSIPLHLKETREFAFTATSDGQGGWTATAGEGVTYAAILDALKSSSLESLVSTPLVFAKISVPALNKTIIARFSGIDSGSTGILTATVVEYFNGAYCVMALDVYSDGRTLVTVQPIPTQS